MEPADGTQVSLSHLKLTENTAAFNDDTNVYSLGFSHSVDSTNINGDVTYLIDQNYVTSTTSSRSPQQGLHFWNIGIRGNADVNGLTVRGDVEIQTGKVKMGSGTDTKYKGYAFLLGGDFALANATVGAEFAYGSGDKIESATKNEIFVTSLGADQQHYTYVYEDRSCSAASSTCMLGTGLANTWYIKVGADVEVNSDLNVGADVYYLQAAKKISSTYTNKDIGTEIDANLTYKIDKNLVYFVEAGYLFAGDLNKNFSTNNQNPDDPYVLRHGLTLTF